MCIIYGGLYHHPLTSVRIMTYWFPQIAKTTVTHQHQCLDWTHRWWEYYARENSIDQYWIRHKRINYHTLAHTWVRCSDNRYPSYREENHLPVNVGGATEASSPYLWTFSAHHLEKLSSTTHRRWGWSIPRHSTIIPLQSVWRRDMYSCSSIVTEQYSTQSPHDISLGRIQRGLSIESLSVWVLSLPTSIRIDPRFIAGIDEIDDNDHQLIPTTAREILAFINWISLKTEGHLRGIHWHLR